MHDRKQGMGELLLTEVCFNKRGQQKCSVYQWEEKEISASEGSDQNSLLMANSVETKKKKKDQSSIFR